MAEVILWQGQERLLKDTSHYFHGVVGAVGYGKTEFGTKWFWLRRQLNRKSHHSLVVAPKNDLLINVNAEAISEYLDTLGYKRNTHYRFVRDPSNMRFEWFWGGVTLLRSAETWRRIVGYSTSDVWIDEAGLCPKEVLTECVKRNRCPQAKHLQILLTGCGEGWLYEWLEEIYDEGAKFSEDEKRLVLHGSAYENKLLPQQYIDQLEDQFAGNEASQIVYIHGGLASIASGNVYSYIAKKDRGPYNPNRENMTLHLTWDFNVGLTGWTAIQQEQGEHRCVAEAPDCRGTDEACLAFIDAFPPSEWRHHTILVHGDANGWHSDTRTAGNDYVIIEQVLQDHYPRLKVVAGRYNPHVTTRITAVNRGFNKNLLKIGENCPTLANSLAKTRYDDRYGGLHKPAGEAITHRADGLGYYVMDEMPVLDRDQLTAKGHR